VIAMTRGVSPSIAACELTHVDRVPIDYAQAVAQHEAYSALLRSLGCAVEELTGDPAYPDCVFIEDTAVVLDDVAVITRPGAESRRGETRAVAEALAKYRRLAKMTPPATLDGGDVLVLGDRIYVGDSERSNDAGREQLRRLTGREVIAVALHGALHLKTAVTRVSEDALLVNRDWVDTAPFAGWSLIDADPREPFGANAMLVDRTVVYPREMPHTRARLEAAGLDVRTVAAGELAKAEGGVTCCALLME
jgi:dimethylargininase